MFRAGLVFALIAFLPVLASANGSMGLALEMFDFAYWWPYVAAMVALEAWMIGRRIGDGWPKALVVSILANAMTAFCCPSLATVGLHGTFVGSQLNPNPFGNAVALFTAFGVVSALLETLIWKVARPVVRDRSVFVPGDRTIFGRSLLAHAVGVPLALLILLIPSRPYKGLESTTLRVRRRFLQGVVRAYAESGADSGGLARISDVGELIRRFGPTAYQTAIPDDWAAAYVPSFNRFDSEEARRSPLEWNSHLTGLRVGSGEFDVRTDHWIWAARWPGPSGYVGYEINLADAHVRFFGYALPPKSAIELDRETDAAVKAEHESE